MSGMIRYRPSPAIAVASLALLVAVGGVALASIPGPGGVINACSSRRTGSLRVIDSTKRCSKTRERTLTWNLQGPRGLQGSQGIQGPQGLQGQAGQDGQNGTNGTNGTDGTPGRDAASTVMGTTTSAISPLDPNNGSFFLMAPSGPGAPGGGPAQEQLSPNATIVARDLSVRVGTAPSANTALKFTLTDDLVDTPLTCTVNSGSQTCDSGGTTATIAAGSRLSLKVTNPGTVMSASSNAEWGWRATTP